MSGDFEIETRVSSLDAVNAWTKAGLIIRAAALDASAPHALIFVTPSREAWRFSGGRREASRASTRPDR